MTDPKDLKDLLEGMEQRWAEMRKWQQSPEGKRARVRYEESQREARTRELRELLNGRGVPESARLRSLALDENLEGAAVDAVRGALEWGRKHRRGPVLFLSGGPGTGKTVAVAWAIAQNCLGRSVFRYARDAGRLATAQFGEEAKDAGALERVALLALDEAGLERDPGALVELLIRRVNADRPTLLTTNLEPPEIAARYFGTLEGGERLRSRIGGQKRSGCPWFHACGDVDLRQQDEVPLTSMGDLL